MKQVKALRNEPIIGTDALKANRARCIRNIEIANIGLDVISHESPNESDYTVNRSISAVDSSDCVGRIWSIDIFEILGIIDLDYRSWIQIDDRNKSSIDERQYLHMSADKFAYNLPAIVDGERYNRREYEKRRSQFREID